MAENTTAAKPYKQVLTKVGRYARQWMSIALILTDLFSLLLAFTLAGVLRVLLLGKTPLSQFYSLWPILVFFILAFAWRGLYPALGLSPVNELRTTTSTVSLVFLILLAGTFLFKISGAYSRLILTVAWFLSLVLIQGNRWLLRIVSSAYWGEPIAVFGDGPNTEHMINLLSNNNHLGMRPSMVIKGEKSPSQAERDALKDRGITTALLVLPEVSEEVKNLVVNDGQFRFRRVLLISNFHGIASLGVITHDLEGILGMEVRQNLLNFWQRGLKRSLDMILALLLLVLVSPLLLIIAILIKLEGKGGIFYKQCRVGRNGREFKMWKFRTMNPQADQTLQDCLEADPQLKQEWFTNQKMKNDPRLTRVGKLLRKWSMDELPQLINVIRGEMSLVGPRPFFSESGPILWQCSESLLSGPSGHDRHVASFRPEQDDICRAGPSG